MGSLRNAEQVGGWVSGVRFPLKRGCDSPPMEAFSMWASGPQSLASSPLGMLVQLHSASQILFQELGTLWVLSPGSGQGTHRESLFRLGPTRKRGFQKLIFSLAYSPHSYLEVPPLSAQCLTCILEPQGTKIQTLESHCLAPQPQCPF